MHLHSFRKENATIVLVIKIHPSNMYIWCYVCMVMCRSCIWFNQSVGGLVTCAKRLVHCIEMRIPRASRILILKGLENRRFKILLYNFKLETFNYSVKFQYSIRSAWHLIKTINIKRSRIRSILTHFNQIEA